MIKVLLFDIEGTTTDIAFVHKTLFPYSLKRMGEFVRANTQHPAVLKVDQEVNAAGDLEKIIATLEGWIRDDLKHPALKEIQGLIWDEGYAQKDYLGHVYPDVQPAWQQWKANGLTLVIYSSGSVHAQKAIFRHSVAGDLTEYLSAYFDTSVGAKKEKASYQNIARALKHETSEIVFFSDITGELDAARASGMGSVQVVRDGQGPLSDHRWVSDFSDLNSFL